MAQGGGVWRADLDHHLLCSHFPEGTMLLDAANESNAKEKEKGTTSASGFVSGEYGRVELGDCMDLRSCLHLDNVDRNEWVPIIY